MVFNTVGKYRTKVLEIEAIQFENNVNTVKQIEEFLHLNVSFGFNSYGDSYIELYSESTPWDMLKCSEGDWIVKNSDGTISIVPNGIFKKYYELV